MALGQYLKIAGLSQKQLLVLDTVQIPTSIEERSVGYFIYEIGRGKNIIQAASRKMILKTSADLVENSRNSKKKAAEIMVSKVNWNKK